MILVVHKPQVLFLFSCRTIRKASQDYLSEGLLFIGVPGRNRTYDQRLRRPLLYPLSYWDTGHHGPDKNMERVKGIEPS